MTADRTQEKPLTPADVTGFWFAAGAEKWFRGGPGFDAEIAGRFGEAAEAAARGEFDAWAETGEGMLALILVLDQFRRNIHRGSAAAFAADPKALALALRAIDRGDDRAVEPGRRMWFYLPLEHAEDLQLQERCVALFEASGDEDLVKWAVMHRDIIARFGRFPHRNEILGRVSSAQEDQFLADGGFAG